MVQRTGSKGMYVT